MFAQILLDDLVWDLIYIRLSFGLRSASGQQAKAKAKPRALLNRLKVGTEAEGFKVRGLGFRVWGLGFRALKLYDQPKALNPSLLLEYSRNAAGILLERS